MTPDPDFLYAPEAIELLPWADKLPPANQSLPPADDNPQNAAKPAPGPVFTPILSHKKENTP